MGFSKWISQCNSGQRANLVVTTLTTRFDDIGLSHSHNIDINLFIYAANLVSHGFSISEKSIWMVQVLHGIRLEVGSRPSWTCVVCGPKKSGKSTFARTLCNMLLQNHSTVALLDTDCGQPQFGPAGMVSITYIHSPVLVPPHLLLHQPDESVLIGDTSPQNNPLTYLNGIRKLHHLHHSRSLQGKRTPQPPHTNAFSQLP